MWTGSRQLHRNTNFNHKSCLILGDRCGKVSSEKISIHLDVMTGSMDFRKAFGLRPADVKAFIHSACQADTVDTSDAGGAGRRFVRFREVFSELPGLQGVWGSCPPHSL